MGDHVGGRRRIRVDGYDSVFSRLRMRVLTPCLLERRYGVRGRLVWLHPRLRARAQWRCHRYVKNNRAHAGFHDMVFWAAWIWFRIRASRARTAFSTQAGMSTYR